MTDYHSFTSLGLQIDMTRGKPSAAQLDMIWKEMEMQSISTGYVSRDGLDCRNYGALLGLPEARELGGEFLGISPANVVVAGNSSLELMHDVLSFAWIHGFRPHLPWSKVERPAIVCPVPGYDRHFAICEALGFRMLTVPLTGTGPDMNAVEAIVASDPSVKAMWCMPTHSNPSGDIYTDSVVARLAAMRTAAPDFRLLWDDAYRFHHLDDSVGPRPNILEICEAAGYPDRPIVFASTSKITFASAGIAFLASSLENLKWWERYMSLRSIGPDKLNQLRHVRVLNGLEGVRALMLQHRALLKPKFDAVLDVFDSTLSSLHGVSWTRPRGGYFICMELPAGRARRVVELAAGAGIALTPSGATFPLGADPGDKYLRIAPSFPSVELVSKAALGIALSVRHAIDEMR